LLLKAIEAASFARSKAGNRLSRALPIENYGQLEPRVWESQCQ